jgi:hypothetical protein
VATAEDRRKHEALSELERVKGTLRQAVREEDRVNRVGHSALERREAHDLRRWLMIAREQLVPKAAKAGASVGEIADASGLLTNDVTRILSTHSLSA